ncbi:MULTISPECIES: asparagine synthase (glutamine-hydrolyzing) [unclassified Pseudoalteromonas]|uniref:asparagine synthase (glutamine-hydrolyzing) n=1 Tax=unclassified Pseudoalteromonas TaxID=194690 RepID=UPI0025B4A1D1|nr:MULTISPECIES: asparagine synthase (glutamine-hydrolyzing) [unclassified Pseudoalteromonas]MDN3408131.1 asparagine synthase (glutamine-hydrolyzing) [Pseudoalteromonas sp. APC 3894]MDN3415771.1 asparagine synthase (glutamine-hydrolyzing) [Pseudoalteromonas sp. APC 3227]MDN3419469.1 asparagine synthase (glutamine-hydrolyzing) [Pseudoalteromonas sp. APC 3895]MDN3422838.1 asparagine synthase (glutamine-hydrolyzing) [Pseudoalteromonas sp. APC 3896]
MCGISGILFKDEAAVYNKQIKDMNSFILHRGPDDQGIYISDNFAFGHTRLSIIDTSKGGHQPMHYADRYVITFNGEIYNYLEIKSDLIKLGYKFENNSDTEVILAGYMQWGDKVLDRLNGMFAFAIYDKQDKSCFLARDRAGVKPLYYAICGDAFYFFSEPKQVILSKIIKAVPNKQAINDYLALQFSLTENTFFDGIKKLMPGNAIKFSNNHAEIYEYWSLDNVCVNNEESKRDALQEIKTLVNDAVNLRLRADVPLGAYLSGGIDSSIVASIASENLTELSTYTFTSKGSPAQDESHVAQKTSGHIGSKHHEIEIDYDDILELWKQSVYFMDEPEVGFSLLPQMQISKEVSKELKVVLGGQGGDELFYGYSWHSKLAASIFHFQQGAIPLTYKIKLAANLIKNTPTLKGKIKTVMSLTSLKPLALSYFDFWSQNGVFNLLRDKNVKNRFLTNISENHTLLSIKKFEYKYWLQALLHVEDRSSMSASLESRTPLLDYRIAEYVFSLPPEYMINGVLNKEIFVDAFKDKLLEDVHLNTNKKGYSAPIADWFSNPKVKTFIDSVLNCDESFIYQFVTIDNKKKLSVRQIWMLISLEIWYQEFIGVNK